MIKQKKKLFGVKRKKFTMFRTKVKSRHPTHSPLRTELPLLPFRSIVRLGSTTKSNGRIECNTVEGVKNSANKLLMKQCFTRAEVKTADWWRYIENIFVHEYKDGSEEHLGLDNLPYPIVCKSLFGSRGEGNTLVKSKQELEKWMIGKNLNNYIFERFYSYLREYRLHVTKNGCFYSCRKMLKTGTPEDKKWTRHDDNCVWILENNDSFDKPVNWDLIVNDCIKALKSLQLDICCFDVKVQSKNDLKGVLRPNPEWIIIESGSAPSFATITTQKYLEQIPKVLKEKYAL